MLRDVRIHDSANNAQSDNFPLNEILVDELHRLSHNNESELKLSKELISALKSDDVAPLPDAWSALISLYYSPAEEYWCHLKGVSGPSGANLFARFCHLDDRLTDVVKQYLCAEETLNPDVIYAEVAHMPMGRPGNILQRPILRDYEIVYLAQSEMPEDRQIKIPDLLISVRNNQVVLRSQRHNKRVLPRLSSAHSYTAAFNLPIYRFLCSLQQQGVVGALAWSWGPLDNLSFLPRVTYRNTIFSPAFWNLRKKHIESILHLKGMKFYKEIQNLRNKIGLPSIISIIEGDNEMPFYLEDPFSVDVFRTYLAKYKFGIRLNEVLASQFDLPLKINGRPYANEIIIPFLRQPSDGLKDPQ